MRSFAVVGTGIGIGGTGEAAANFSDPKSTGAEGGAASFGRAGDSHTHATHWQDFWCGPAALVSLFTGLETGAAEQQFVVQCEQRAASERPP